MTKDRAEIIESLSIGDFVKVSFNIRGNEYQGKYYVSLQGWKVEKNPSMEEGTVAPVKKPFVTNDPKDYSDTPPSTATNTTISESIEDDLPF